MIRNRNVKAPEIVRDAIDIGKIDLEADPNATLAVGVGNRYIQTPTLATGELVTAAAGINGAIVYDTSANALKACIDGSYISLGAAGASNAFLTFDTEAGTNVVADTGTDTVVLTGNSGAISVTGTEGTDTVAFTIANSGVTATMLAATLDISGKTVTLPDSQTLTTPTIASFTNATHTHADAAGGGAITYVGNVLSTGNLTVNAAAGASTITIGNLSTGGIVVSDNMTVGAPILLSGTNDISFYDSDLKIWSSVNGQLDIAGDVEVQVATATLDVNASTAVEIDTAAYSIDSTASSNVSVTGAQLQLSTITTGELDITAAELLDINAGAGLDVDVTGAVDVLASQTFAIAGTGASTIGTTSGALTLSTTTTGTLGIQSAAIVDIDAKGTSAVTVNTADHATSTTGAVTLTTGDVASSTGDSGDITLTTGAAGGSGARGEILLDSGTVSIDADTTIATAKALNLGTSGAIGGTVSIYRDGAGAKSVEIVPATGITFVDNFVQIGAYTFGTGTSAVSLNGDVTIAATKNLTMSGASTVATGTGTVSLNGDVTIAADKNLVMSGAATIATGTGAITLNGTATVTTGKNFAVVDGTVGLGSGAISTTYATMVTNLNADKVDDKHVVDITAPSYINFITDGAFTALTSYNGPGQQVENANEEAFFVVPTAGTLTKLYTVVGTAPGGADTLTYTIRKGGADQTITCVISASEVAANDTAHSVDVVAGDKISLKLVSSATTVANSSATLEFRGACA